MRIDASAIILAGGESRRMGRQKALLPFGAETIIERLMAELSAAFGELIVVAAPRGALLDDLAAITAGRDISLIRDPEAFAGPAPALVRGLGAARYATAFVCSCDLPLLQVELALALCAMIDGYEAVVPEIAAQSHPLCAAYRAKVGPAIAAIVADGEARLNAIVKQLVTRRATEAELRTVDPDLRSLLNVNTPADYARALALAGF
jgi:molybdopterin-guanine dinucleotide biosynthesis protein A